MAAVNLHKSPGEYRRLGVVVHPLAVFKDHIREQPVFPLAEEEDPELLLGQRIIPPGHRQRVKGGIPIPYPAIGTGERAAIPRAASPRSIGHIDNIVLQNLGGTRKKLPCLV